MAYVASKGPSRDKGTVGTKAEAERPLRHLFHESRGDTVGAGTIAAAGLGHMWSESGYNLTVVDVEARKLVCTLPLAREGG